MEKYRDVKPDGPSPEQSRKERLANWFYYNKRWPAAGAVLLAILGSADEVQTLLEEKS